jgi:hypothetical protein
MMELKLPSRETAESMVEDDTFDRSFYDNIPSDYGLKLNLPEDSTVVDGVRVKRRLEARAGDDGANGVVIGATQDDELDYIETLASQNNFFVDMPYNDNLKKNSVVRGCMKSAIEAVTEIERNDFSDENDNDKYGGEQPVQKLLIPTTPGDGAPSSAELKIIEEALRDGNVEEYSRLVPFSDALLHWGLLLSYR